MEGLAWKCWVSHILCSEPTRHVFWLSVLPGHFQEIHHRFLPILDMCERMTFEKPVQRLVSPSPFSVSFLLRLPLSPSLPLSLAPSLCPLSAPPFAGPQEKKNVGFDCHLLGIWKNDSVGIRGRRGAAGGGGGTPLLSCVGTGSLNLMLKYLMWKNYP